MGSLKHFLTGLTSWGSDMLWLKRRTFSGTDNLRKVYFFMRHLDELAFSGFSILIC